MSAPGWYHAEGDPPGTQRYWDGDAWIGEPVTAAPAVDPSVSGHRRGSTASEGDRIIGRLIDILIGFAMLVVIVMLDIGGATNPNVLGQDDVIFQFNDRALDTTAEFLIWGLFFFLWSVVFIHLKGGTPGKLMMGIRIVDAETGQMPVDLAQAALRSANQLLPLLGLISIGAGEFASGVGLIIGIVSLVLLFSDNLHRTVMDRVANTHVVKL